jgi:hypothetical protein
MHRYLKHSIQGFAICCAISFVGLFIEPVPWENQLFVIAWAYFCFSGAFLASVPDILLDMYAHKGIWAQPRQRWLGVPVIGASLGLFVLGWITIFGPKDLEQVRTNEFERFLCGAGPESLWVQARHLVPRAEVLGMCKVLLESSFQYAFAFAAIATLGAWIYDQVKSTADPSKT